MTEAGINKIIIFENICVLSGIHAREWISPATALWTIHSVLVDEKMLNSLDWFIHPIVNPDGFTFTHEHVIIIIISNIISIIIIIFLTIIIIIRESLATKAVRSPAGHSLSVGSSTRSMSLLAPAGVDILSQSGHVHVQVRPTHMFK